MILPAEHFVDTVAVNVDNSKLSDAEFRDFIRNTIPLYKKPERETVSGPNGDRLMKYY